MSDNTDYRYTAAELTADLGANDGMETPITAPPSVCDTEHKDTTAEAADTIRRLAALKPIDYDLCREQEAKRLGVRVSTLDDAGKRRRLRPEAGAEAGSSVLFDEPQPWPESVDGAALLDALTETFGRYLVLPAGAADVLALWTAHTHVYEAFTHTPRLNVKGPDKNCGKSLLLDVLQTVVAKGLIAENVTTAVTFRLIDAEAPTLLIDKYDSFLRDKEELCGALNAGQKRGGVFLRCKGDKNEILAIRPLRL